MFRQIFLSMVWITLGLCQHSEQLISLFLAHSDSEVSVQKCLEAQWLFNYLLENNFHMWQGHQQSSSLVNLLLLSLCPLSPHITCPAGKRLGLVKSKVPIKKRKLSLPLPISALYLSFFTFLHTGKTRLMKHKGAGECAFYIKAYWSTAMQVNAAIACCFFPMTFRS